MTKLTKNQIYYAKKKAKIEARRAQWRTASQKYYQNNRVIIAKRRAKARKLALASF